MIHAHGCTTTEARHQVHQKIADYVHRTGNPLWHPIGNHGYASVHRAISENRVLDNELR